MGNTSPREELNALHMKFSRDAALSRIPLPHLLKQEQLQAFVMIHSEQKGIRSKKLRRSGIERLKLSQRGRVPSQAAPKGTSIKQRVPFSEDTANESGDRVPRKGPQQTAKSTQRRKP